MSETLYRKYRPKNFSEVLGQNHIVTTLTNAIKTNRIAHAYLFTGSRGTGKTTSARLLAQAVNCMPRKDFTPPSKSVCDSFLSGSALDLIEIDAASHTGVENIRDLRDTIALAPSQAPYKVYIIDEVHMLSTGAFNALLKTLEEPPEHAIFILATTEIHKVPETIISRCQRFDFARVSVTVISEKINHIATSEGVKISPEAVEMIAVAARGGMRDAESVLAQVFSLEDKDVTAKEVSMILGTTTNKDVYALLDAFTAKDVHAAMTLITDVVNKGFNLDTYIATLIIKSRALMYMTLDHDAAADELGITKAEHTKLTAIAASTTTNHVLAMIATCIEAKNQLAGSVVPQLPLEVAAVKICDTGSAPQPSQTQQPTSKDRVQPDPVPTVTQKKEPETPSEKQPNESTGPAPIKRMKTGNTTITVEDIRTKWSECVSLIRVNNPSLSMVLSSAIPFKVDGDLLTIGVQFSLHKEKIMLKETQLTITKALDTIYNNAFMISVDVIDADTMHATSPSELLSRASSIVGGGMVQT